MLSLTSSLSTGFVRKVEILESANNPLPLDRPVSRLVLGTLLVDPAVLDEWVRLGGNAIDTARVYGDGAAERDLGAWLASRPDVRDDLVLISKGAHPDGARRRVTREDIEDDLHASLAALGRPIDVYMLHRDDPSLPVGPIVECLNEHLRAGRVRALGASNWSCARIDEANAYAADHGLEGFCCSSPHLSLATQNEEHWDDTRSARDPTIFAWHERGGLPVFAWSAQSRGFFAGHESESVDRVYDSADNRERRRRAGELAARLGCTANQVALAWVLRQPFPVYAVIGARTVAQLRETVGALEIELSDDEARWLDLRSSLRA
jgi:aryl-alcohol dehydrogenase-like predicted oxidoreductase